MNHWTAKIAAGGAGLGSFFVLMAREALSGEMTPGQEWAFVNTMLLLLLGLGGGAFATWVFRNRKRWTGPSQQSQIDGVERELRINEENRRRNDRDIAQIQREIPAHLERIHGRLDGIEGLLSVERNERLVLQEATDRHEEWLRRVAPEREPR